jgi:hypothetical protein
VPNYGFAGCYTYVGNEKYRKALVSLRRAEYCFWSFVSAKSDDGTPIANGEEYAIKVTRLETG